MSKITVNKLLIDTGKACAKYMMRTWSASAQPASSATGRYWLTTPAERVASPAMAAFAAWLRAETAG